MTTPKYYNEDFFVISMFVHKGRYTRQIILVCGRISHFFKYFSQDIRALPEAQYLLEKLGEVYTSNFPTMMWDLKWHIKAGTAKKLLQQNFWTKFN